MRWIGAGRGIEIQMQVLAEGDSRRVTASVAVVVSRTPGGNVWPLRRLRKLPYVREVDAALGWAGWMLGEGASGRRRAGVVRDPIHNLPSR